MKAEPQKAESRQAAQALLRGVRKVMAAAARDQRRLPIQQGGSVVWVLPDSLPEERLTGTPRPR